MKRSKSRAFLYYRLCVLCVFCVFARSNNPQKPQMPVVFVRLFYLVRLSSCGDWNFFKKLPFYLEENFIIYVFNLGILFLLCCVVQRFPVCL